MKNFKVVTIVGTRPEIIRLSSVIKKLSTSLDHTLVHTGQNYDYELNEIFFNDMDISPPDLFLSCKGKNAAEVISEVISKTDKMLEEIKPDALLVLGDTNSTLSALSAKRRKIPIFHMEAGNRCFDQRVPEEINRKIIDHVADVNLTYSSIAREYLLREGINPQLVIKTGSPMLEVINDQMAKIDGSKILNKLNLRKRKYFVVSAHREENVDSEKHFNNLISILNNMSKLYPDYPIIFSVHPRTQKVIDAKSPTLSKNVMLSKPLSFSDYNKLQIMSSCVLSDSGTIFEEASILKFPAINIRDCHERPEAMEECPVITAGLDSERVMQSLKFILNQPRGPYKIVDDYNYPNVSEKVLKIILGYTDLVNRIIWKNY